MTSVKTTCAYCGVGCGILATETDGKVRIEGDPSHPANYGRLCSKGLALGETLDPSSRLAHPSVAGATVSWADATQAVADRLTAAIRTYGPDSVAFYVSGQLLTEDYYVANKLMKGFIGSANIDTNSRLCMASTVAGHTRAFGADMVPGDYQDLEIADLVVLVGSNLAWCHPVLFQRLKAAQQKHGTKMVVIDPRHTETVDIADLFIPVMPDGDVLLFGGLLAYLNENGLAPTAYTKAHVNGYAEALAAAKAAAPALKAALKARGIETEVETFYRLFAGTEKVVTVFSQGVNQAHNGTDRVNAIINCHLATGRIGRPGMGPFSVTGQPNAMGGREVGGLANMLAAHMGFSKAEQSLVQDFWQAPTIAPAPGLRAVDMFDAVHDGRIKAIWIMATNPAVSLPNASKVREALAKCETVIVSDCVAGTDTQAYADICLPACGWGEKDGTVTNSDRTISRQRAFRAPYADARPDWRIISDVATAMGFGDAFPYTCPAEIFREHATLSGFRNTGSRAFDIGGYADISPENYDALMPGQWPHRADGTTAKRLFANGYFYTDDRKAVMVPVRHLLSPTLPSRRFPLLLNTGRYRDQWHTMTRTGLAPTLSGHRPEPLLDIHPDDALSLDLKDGGFARLTSKHGQATVRLRISADQKPGELFLPMHWSLTHAGQALTGSLIAPDVDPQSKQPAFKTTAVRLEPAPMVWRALLFSRTPMSLPPVDYWTRTRQKTSHLTRVAGSRADQFESLATHLKSETDGWLEAWDVGADSLRMARLDDGRLHAALFAGPDLAGISPAWIDSLFAEPSLPADTVGTLLAGRSRTAGPDEGPIVCACFQVGRYRIEAAIRDGGLTSAEAVGTATCAGTNCGSCVPEIKSLLMKEAKVHAA